LNKAGFPLLLITIFFILISGIIYILTRIPAFFYSTFILLLFFAFIVFFYRDPEREFPENENIILSPADGKVIKIEKTTDNGYIGGEVFNIKIFMSLFNVHINRVPFGGIIEKTEYKKGTFKAANVLEKSENNEQNILFVKSEKFKYIIKQVAGMIAKRIECHKKPDEEIVKGERFGIIHFGSRVELIIPATVNIVIKEGEKVKGGVTPIARI